MTGSQWRDFFLQKGILDEEVIAPYVEYATTLLERGLPVVFDKHHLSALTGRTVEFINEVVNQPHSFWRSFVIPKRRGGERKIDVPFPSLLGIQQWILRNILAKVEVSPYCHGFVPRKSIFTNVRWHVGARQVFCVDLADFFPSITAPRVNDAFKRMGYNNEVATLLTLLTTLDGHLPQGAPTSPALSNIVASPLDYRLQRFARIAGLHYTRYADDLTFSGRAVTFGQQRLIQKIISESGFRINPDKERLFISPNTPRIITGISIGQKLLHLPRTTKRRLRQELHYVMTYGLHDHIDHCRISRRRYLQSLLGRVSFWLSIEPTQPYALRARTHLLNLIRSGLADV